MLNVASPCHDNKTRMNTRTSGYRYHCWNRCWEKCISYVHMYVRRQEHSLVIACTLACAFTGAFARALARAFASAFTSIIISLHVKTIALVYAWKAMHLTLCHAALTARQHCKAFKRVPASRLATCSIQSQCSRVDQLVNLCHWQLANKIKHHNLHGQNELAFEKSHYQSVC